jgi:hypothetical protein
MKDCQECHVLGNIDLFCRTEKLPIPSPTCRDKNEDSMDAIVYAYTRKQALEDGEKFRLDDKLALEAGFNWPVFVTEGVYGIISRAVANEKYLNDFDGIVWDILTVLKFQINRSSKDGSY